MPTPVRLPRGYIDKVRFSYERELTEEMLRQTTVDLPSIPRSLVADSFEDTTPLSPTLAPRAFSLARQAADVLDVQVPFELLQTRVLNDHLNAQAVMTGESFKVRLIGAVAKMLDDGALLAMLGHEFGHLLAHGPSSPLPYDKIRCEKFSEGFLARVWVSRELTADRFALLACQDLDAAVRLEVASLLGDSPEAMGTDEERFLDECCHQVEHGEPGRLVVKTHPAPAFRLFAARLFWRSEVFQRLTGKGPGDLTLDEADRELRARLIEATEQLSFALPQEQPQPPVFAPISAAISALDELEISLPDPSGVLETLRGQAKSLVHRVRAGIAQASAHDFSQDLGALEARFRKLELEAGFSEPSIPPDLEARFQELERRASLDERGDKVRVR